MQGDNGKISAYLLTDQDYKNIYLSFFCYIFNAAARLSLLSVLQQISCVAHVFHIANEMIGNIDHVLISPNDGIRAGYIL